MRGLVFTGATSPCGRSIAKPKAPHPPLRGAFSRGEKVRSLSEGRASELGQAAAQFPALPPFHAADGVPLVELQVRDDPDPARDLIDAPLDGVGDLPATDQGIGAARREPA